ncbi:hypothetical protein [Terrarubrum flagellatum]|uniref:hypothetical protein n=1 Tax=Terrirubrum flagellatum TaxID=2895980 RepID=UPI0031455C33
MFEAPVEAADRGRSLAPIAAAFVAAMISVGAIGLLRWTPAAPLAPRFVKIELGERILELDEALIHPGPQRQGGKLDRADLILGWPDLGPAHLVAWDDRGHAAPPAASAHVLMSLQAADGIDPATRSLAVHGRFIEPEIWSNPGGLIMRRFKAGSPYEGEELVMTPDGAEFAARCPTAGVGRHDLPPRCLATFRAAGVDALVSFDPALLPEWQRLKSGVLNLVGRALR